ncbi:MAG: hypothetical protein GXX94_00185 [Chloroflexi bacterium]|nr:hypothetical protein [Chloroflexota bacterium]
MSPPALPRRYLAFHSAGGAALYSALGAAWALLGLVELRPVAMPWAAVALGVITGLLLIGSFRAMQHASQIADEEMTPEARAERARRTGHAHWVLRVEGFAITLVSAALFLTSNHAYVAPATALIVGLHFVALAPIHKAPGDGIAGLLIVALAIATMIWVPGIPSIHRNPMNLAAGFGTGGILWMGALAMLLSRSPETPET